MERALRASLSCTAWIARAPPIHFKLTPVDAPAVPITAADAECDANADSEVALTFIGSMPLPRFLGEYLVHSLVKLQQLLLLVSNLYKDTLPEFHFVL